MTNLNDTQLSHKVETPKDDKPIPAFYLRILTKKEKKSDTFNQVASTNSPIYPPLYSACQQT